MKVRKIKMGKILLYSLGFAIIAAILAVLRGVLSAKSGRNSNGNVFDEIGRQAVGVRESRKIIYEKRDAFRGTQMIENIISEIINPSSGENVGGYLPGRIELRADGIYCIYYNVAEQRYNTLYNKVIDESQLPSCDYFNGCALFLLIQEKYPNQYDFPNTKITELESEEGVQQIRLNLKSAGNLQTW